MPRWKWKAYSTAKRVVGAAGFDLTHRHFYSPIPGRLGEDVWSFRSPLHGIEMDLDAQLRWIDAQVSAYREEFRPPIAITDDYTFRYGNGFFDVGDADVLYGTVRSGKPRRIVEFGSGHTSAVIQLAVARNAADGAACDYRIYDPFATDYLGASLRHPRVCDIPAERVEDSVFRELEAGDILFVDTTHTVRIGGDVNRIVLEGLPLLAPGVVVHFHDIFLPYSYPRVWFEEHEYYWSEQYLLQAFLSFNREFEVLAGLQALARERPVELGRSVASMAAGGNPSSFWLRRRLT